MFRDSHGRIAPVAQPSGTTTCCHDGNGKTVGRSQVVGKRVLYYDANGKPIGTATDHAPHAASLLFN